MSLNRWVVFPGQRITDADRGKTVWCVGVFEWWSDDGNVLERQGLVALSPPPKPLEIVQGCPLREAIGELDSVDADGAVWVKEVDIG